MSIRQVERQKGVLLDFYAARPQRTGNFFSRAKLSNPVKLQLSRISRSAMALAIGGGFLVGFLSLLVPAFEAEIPTAEALKTFTVGEPKRLGRVPPPAQPKPRHAILPAELPSEWSRTTIEMATPTKALGSEDDAATGADKSGIGDSLRRDTISGMTLASEEQRTAIKDLAKQRPDLHGTYRCIFRLNADYQCFGGDERENVEVGARLISYFRPMDNDHARHTTVLIILN